MPRPDRKASMCVISTPIEDHIFDLGLYVKREDLCCPPGPHFSKCRGVFSHIAARPEQIIGVLDTGHSQGGWAVAQACKLLKRQCILYYPVRKADRNVNGDGQWGDALKPQQAVAQELGASLIPLAAGRSAVLYHQAKSNLWREHTLDDCYMMPNALKLPETVAETAAEFCRSTDFDVDHILVSASSATIAAGVVLGAHRSGWSGTILIHMGYSRPEQAVLKYIHKMSGITISRLKLVIVDEKYDYADAAKPGPTPPFACNEHYDLKAFRWWASTGRAQYEKALLWNIG